MRRRETTRIKTPVLTEGLSREAQIVKMLTDVSILPAGFRARHHPKSGTFPGLLPVAYTFFVRHTAARQLRYRTGFPGLFGVWHHLVYPIEEDLDPRWPQCGKYAHQPSFNLCVLRWNRDCQTLHLRCGT